MDDANCKGEINDAKDRGLSSLLNSALESPQSLPSAKDDAASSAFVDEVPPGTEGQTTSSTEPSPMVTGSDASIDPLPSSTPTAQGVPTPTSGTSPPSPPPATSPAATLIGSFEAGTSLQLPPPPPVAAAVAAPATSSQTVPAAASLPIQSTPTPAPTALVLPPLLGPRTSSQILNPSQVPGGSFYSAGQLPSGDERGMVPFQPSSHLLDAVQDTPSRRTRSRNWSNRSENLVFARGLMEMLRVAKASNGKGFSRAEQGLFLCEQLHRNGFTDRTTQNCLFRLNNMKQSWTRINAWERSSGNKSYWDISEDERTDNHLPSAFDRDVFEEVAKFMLARGTIPSLMLAEGGDEGGVGGGGGSASGFGGADDECTAAAATPQSQLRLQRAGSSTSDIPPAGQHHHHQQQLSEASPRLQMPLESMLDLGGAAAGGGGGGGRAQALGTGVASTQEQQQFNTPVAPRQNFVQPALPSSSLPAAVGKQSHSDLPALSLSTQAVTPAAAGEGAGGGGGGGDGGEGEAQAHLEAATATMQSVIDRALALGGAAGTSSLPTVPLPDATAGVPGPSSALKRTATKGTPEGSGTSKQQPSETFRALERKRKRRRLAVEQERAKRRAEFQEKALQLMEMAVTAQSVMARTFEKLVDMM